MCGIAGGIHSGLTKEQAANVLAKLKHRGPDDSGLFMQEHVWLGNTRLAIQDLSQRGHQPMQTPGGRFTIVFNGEIYNHMDLRPELEQLGATFNSGCDTETLLHAYACWGEACLGKLNGDFAFAVFDSDKKEVFIARDGMGVKPLYYYCHEGRLLFSSELKALTGLPGIDYSLQASVFFQYLLFQYCPSADTPFRFIKKLLPGHCIRVPANMVEDIEPKRYYSIPFVGTYAQHSKTDWLSITDQALTNAVCAQLHSDAPLGLTLSGGLDSSLIAALAQKAQPGRALCAFSINTHGAMRAEGFQDDFGLAKLVAKQLGITLHEVSGTLNLESELDTLIWNLDEPQADPAALHMAHISGAAHELGIKVLLSGTGADDVFSGYRRHTILPLLKIVSRTPAFVTPLMQSVAQHFRQSPGLQRALKLVGSAGIGMEHGIVQTHFWTSIQRASGLFRAGILAPDTGSLPYRIFEDLLQEIPREHSSLNKMLFYEQRTFLPHHNLAYIDKLAMAHSVEVRVPFVSREIIALAAGMPTALKLEGKTTKAILREVARPYLPTAIINRGKTGFGAPLRQWMKQDLRTLVSARLLDDSFLSRGIFNRESIESLIRDNQSGKIDGAYTLFSLLSIESWLRLFAPVA